MILHFKQQTTVLILKVKIEIYQNKIIWYTTSPISLLLFYFTDTIWYYDDSTPIRLSIHTERCFTVVPSHWIFSLSHTHEFHAFYCCYLFSYTIPEQINWYHLLHKCAYRHAGLQGGCRFEYRSEFAMKYIRHRVTCQIWLLWCAGS